MTNLQKNEVKQAVLAEIDRLGSANKTAVKCGVSAALISQIRNMNWDQIKDEMWQRIAGRLQVAFTGWQVADITNYKVITSTLHDAKLSRLFIPVSERAGSGKSESVDAFAKAHSAHHVYLIRCDEWAKREFLEELCTTLGIQVPTGICSNYKLSQRVIKFFEERTSHAPLLIIDEADKLKPTALRFLIPFYNRLEDKMGVVILGTENLKKEITKGVRLQKKGFDEIDSRFGRKYITLPGTTRSDVAKIAKANGIHDRVLHTKIFSECEPISKQWGKQNIKVVEDLRRVKRVVKRELLNLKTADHVEG